MKNDQNPPLVQFRKNGEEDKFAEQDFETRRTRSPQHPMRHLILLLSAIGIAVFIISCRQPEEKSVRRSDLPPSNIQHHDLLAVTFPTAESGWACGRWGRIFHTSNGGETWNRQESGTNYTLAGIFFTDSKKGWAIGDGGTIVHTTDGGQSWNRQESPVPFYLFGIHFVDSSNGWIVTEKTTILATQNGGKTWQVQFKDEDYILKRISFCDEYHGWAAGEYGYIYHTNDGGRTWQWQAGEFGISEETGDVIGGDYIFDVLAIDPQTAWVVGIGGYVAQTIDGGRTWQRHHPTGISQQHLFSVSKGKNNTMVIGANYSILTSSDGGKTFAEAATKPSVRYGWLYGVVPRGDSGFAAVGKGGWFYISDNQGTVWNRGTHFNQIR